MTKEEYRKFKSQYEILGQIESERIQRIHINKAEIKKELKFLEELHTIFSKSGWMIKNIEDRLKQKINFRRTVYNAFNRI